MSWQHSQCCNSSSAEDTSFMKYYTKHLVEEIEVIEGAKLTTEQGHMVEFRFQLIPADMK